MADQDLSHAGASGPPGYAVADLTRLAASGGVPDAAVLARRARRWGWWYYIEYWLVNAKAWAVSIGLYMVVMPLVYLIALGLGLGLLVDRGVGTVGGSGGSGGVPYLTFVGPALLVATVVMSVGGELTYPVMAGFKWRRLYWAPRATPVSPQQIAVGHLGGVLIRFVLQSTVFWVMLLLFHAAPSGWSWLTVPVGVLTAAAFGAPLQAYAAHLTDEGYQFAFVQRFVIMPMFLFAGTFFPLSVMPVYLQWIGWISPVWHGTQLARQAAYGAVEPLWLTLVHLAVLLLFTSVGVALARRTYARRLGR
ncbi:MAG: ABC transporter permease [Intrasporangium sp.]|uniref:ABC transporter permease n=1 Tax=Intrasporangium sp. TaxID=1925024 RepID=UPI0026492CB8|nr:ABC transporter permease [Intrasporangium sp.]MDN5795734.1 ABC transporter permease [Intrasporangium sp.]